jgi:putative glutathione S-transferase
LFGPRFTEADIRAFVTLVRFDAAYHGAFKCNLRRVVDYPHLQTYLKRVCLLPSMAATVNIDPIKQGYCAIITQNPDGIVPAGPCLPWVEA